MAGVVMRTELAPSKSGAAGSGSHVGGTWLGAAACVGLAAGSGSSSAGTKGGNVGPAVVVGAIGPLGICMPSSRAGNSTTLVGGLHGVGCRLRAFLARA